MTEGKISRKLMAHFIDTSVTGSPAYARLGADLEEYNVEMSASVETRRNILGETSTTIDGYEKSGSVEPYYAVAGDPLFERLQKIIDEEQTHDKLKTTVVEAHLWTEQEGMCVAYRENAVIEVTSYGGDTTGYQIPYNLHYTGGREKGMFDFATKEFTPDV